MGVLGFIRGHSGSHSESLGSLRFALGVLGFIRCRWVSPWGVVGFNQGVVGFSRVGLAGRWVHPESLGSLGFAIEVAWFVRCRLVHSGTRMGSLGSFGAIEFTRVRAGGRWVH